MAPLLGRLGNGGGTTAGFGFGRRRGPTGPAFRVTGGTIYTPGNGYQYHVFNYPNSDSLIVSGSPEKAPGWAKILMMGGGGGGAANNPGAPGNWQGGGGAGGMLTGDLTLVDGTYPITVGNGGVGAPNGWSPGTADPSWQGQTTTAFGATANGGGSVVGSPSPPSGPGASTSQSPATIPYGTLTGYAGPGSPGEDGAGGYGGGASGNSATGRQIPWMAPNLGSPGQWFGGGGAGGAGSGRGGPRGGGQGGGGNGAANPGRDATPGVNGTGGGGGGGNGGPEGSPKPGGSGVVIVGYLI